jgi:protein-export membrane protein SecD/preprotein translocase SecF subunit
LRHALAFLGIIALVIAAVWFDLNPQVSPIREGLDLRGGMRVILEPDRDEIQKRKLQVTLDAHTMGLVREIMEKRVNEFGLSGATVQIKGENQIVATLPGARKPEEALAQLQKVAQLEFIWLKNIQTKEIPGRPYRMDRIPGEGKNPDQYTFFDTRTNKSVPEQQVLDECRPPIIDGSELLPDSHQAMSTQTGRPEPIVTFHFNDHGRTVFANFTNQKVRELLAVVLDNVIITAPVIEEPITEGKGEIRGGFRTIAEARNLASLLNSGSLPVPLKVVETQTIGATLGMEAIQRSVWAGIGGLALVLIFMLAYYALPGVLADIALLFYAAITFGIFKLGGVVLDLPGITGFILSVGMAVDANILIFERLREEMRLGKTLHAAIDAGFNRAFTSIFDSNVTTWIVCAVLFQLGAPIIKGFALTLAIGVAVSMFTAITVTRTMLHMVVNFPWARDEKVFGLGISWLSNRLTQQGRILDVIARRRFYFGFSIALLAMGLVFLGMGGLKPAIDFTGGSEVQAVFNQPVNIDQINNFLKADNIRDAEITRGSTTLTWTTVTVTLNTQLSVSAQPDLKTRLEQVSPGFEDAAYQETSEKTTTATAVYVTSQAGVPEAAIRRALTADLRAGDTQRPLAKIPQFSVQRREEKRPNLPVVTITSRQITDARARSLEQQLSTIGGGFIRPAYQRQTIGPSIASEVTLKAFESVIVASLLIIVYLTFRFAIGGFMNGLKFGVCAVVALIHDVLTVTGIFALMGWVRGWQVDSLFVTAALTIIGFSVHDTIVVYDRIRENLRNRERGETFEGVANRSITQTFDRSINTSFTVLLVLLALYIFGGQSIKLFSMALLIGIAIGTYSSIFVASPLVVLWERWSNRAAAAAATSGRREDVRLRSAEGTTRVARPTPPTPRPKPTPAAPPAERGEAAPVGAAKTGGPRPSGGSSTIRPKRKRRT